MSFISIPFVVLFITVFLLYYLVKKPLLKKVILLLGSAGFIGYFHISFLIIALVVALITYLLGFKIAKAREKKNIGWLYLSSVLLIIFIWIAFRYPVLIGDFANYLLSFLHIHSRVPEHSILVPLGISFYSFQAISYLTEIYWEEIEPEDNFMDFSIYMLFFMKFLSGPIERPDSFLLQVKEDKSFNYDLVVYGLKLFFLGLMKKTLIADNLAPCIEDVYGSLNDYTGVQLVVIMLMYPIQLYADFSGYTDMALGGAMMFGYKLMNNFDRPFISKTTTELWRRWHISLSSWVRDYVYLPLTSTIRSWGKAGVSLSLFISFVVVGVWHGTNWNFVIYGSIQGLIIIYEMYTADFHNKISKTTIGSKVYNAYAILITFLLFAFSLIFFRADNLTDALYYISHLSLADIDSIKDFRVGLTDKAYLVTGISFVMLLIFEHFNSKKDLINATKSLPGFVRWSIYFIFVCIVIFSGHFSNDNFVYAIF